ncbi:SpoU rRNA methylase [Colletotrichum scovillei]|uniref:rRNA methyltransferase 1, mitochondrial n=1 Tax=Colletotrichum scovillei TaxID=1209932 RepID=A0A9P7REF5_9PEZI|nr:SpoU rRNA methylase [Colletotrichum scovillei]KAF4785246.1 SpoU rRNA methylase [Colletotrichum scovillei]KAG7055153.1 SpoU rRNA methylase [Colletotrichum scovillei]KAG7074569.1 SpoU rRNA methylase [Colletotrichum scovillei]KAG7081598.1 SpoU rRNA methylase [Colletotrichum scovillei]
MSLLTRWSASRPFTATQRAVQLSGNPFLYGQARNGSLSAIHRGIWRSDKPRNDRTDRNSRPASRPRLTESKGRGRSRDAAKSKPDAFSERFSSAIGGRRDGPRDREQRHFKPKKAFQKMQERMKEQEEEGGRKSRSKRFNNPEFSFGKKSLVYQLNRGELKDNVGKLLEKNGAKEEESSKPTAQRESGNDWFQVGRQDRQDGRQRDQYQDRRSDRQRERFQDRRPDRQRDQFSDRRPDRRDNQSGARPSFARERMDSMREGARRELEAAPPRRFGSRQPDHEVSSEPTEFRGLVQYTTAASQFLFGRSVVKAALKNSQRKLYHLYLYQGSNKKESMDDRWILSMAEKKKVKITKLYENDQQLLDKMSKGRPHNGIVMETSPLPQLPITGLGGEHSEPQGYPVFVGRQSKEDVAINGTEGFIPSRPGTARPLVLLLTEILDPGNLGAILRTARFLGVSAVAITKRTSSSITSTVLKASAGASEELQLFSVEDPGAFLHASAAAGWTSYAAVAPTAGLRRDNRQWTPESIEEKKPLLTQPSILVLGNEGTGLPYDIRKKATHEITIPRVAMSSSVDSLNVSVATALLCNSFLRGTAEPSSLTERLQKESHKADAGESMF